MLRKEGRKKRKIRKNCSYDHEFDGSGSTHGKAKNAYKTLAGKHKGKITSERPSHSCKDNIKSDHPDIVCEGVARLILIRMWINGGLL